MPGRASSVALVIDDLHVIASTLAESELGRFIDRQPAKLVIAAGTRSHPEFDISRLMLADELLEITADDLRFRTWEADRLFREHYDMILGPTDVAMLITRTEGWAAGLAALQPGGARPTARRAPPPDRRAQRHPRRSRLPGAKRAGGAARRSADVPDRDVGVAGVDR